ncbi:MAG: glycoside hydrolase family 3 C-terminal domain-containing protein [Kiritimatiellae bacterium]|nr:glycoside hydrolase family 3 C-terminal domain-containing protein [Kiritimatiellia bacterium]
MNMKIAAGSIAAFAAASAAAIPSDYRRSECELRARTMVEQLSPEERVDLLMMDSPAVDRLGIPRYHWWNEALHGIARAGLATVFPQSMGMAASFDSGLQERVGDVVSTETRAKYNLFRERDQREIYKGLTLWSPNVNMFRDPRWGRGQETFGEDPYLSGVMGGAYVRGLQGYDKKYLKTAACAKHFAVHSGPERLRHGFNAKVSARDLREYYLPAFRTLAMHAKVEAFMGAYSALNGVPCCANRELLTDILRGEWGFKGHIVSDVGAVADIHTGHHFTADRVAACKAAIAAGLDLCSEGTYACLRDAIKEGKVTGDELKRPLVQLLNTRVLLGQFDRNGSTPWDHLGEKDVATEANRDLALEAAEKSLVLISNNGALPFDPKKAVCVGVVGPRAMDEVALIGNYCGYAARPSTVFSGVVEEAGPGVRVIGVPEGAHGSDIAIVCLGITAEDEGEEGCSVNNSGGDRTSYSLPQNQLKLLEGYRKSCKCVVSVIFGGSPFDLEPVVRNSDAVILAWYPGEQGGRAVARTIFGKNNPAGRLPITYPKSYDDLPAFADYTLVGRTYRYATKKPAYPFGYGLSYTTFAYSDIRAKKTASGAEITVNVKNTGKLAGDEVVQLYLKAPAAAGDRRLHHLEGFTRVRIAPGASRNVTFTLLNEQFAVFGEDGKATVPSGETAVYVGGGQPGFVDTLSTSVKF